MPDASDDDRYLVVNGRRWRRTDPQVPEALRSELVHELMRARRAVKAGLAHGDDDAVALARSAVHDAKVALGERGEPWWEEPTPEGERERDAATHRALRRARADDDPS